jgi:hypothetical protein
VFKNGARQPFFLSASQRRARSPPQQPGRPIFTFVAGLFPKIKSHYEISGLRLKSFNDPKFIVNNLISYLCPSVFVCGFPQPLTPRRAKAQRRRVNPQPLFYPD